MIRSRAQKDSLKVVRQLDAFSKIPEEYRARGSKIGGLREYRIRTVYCGNFEIKTNKSLPPTVTLISRILIVYLVYIEVNFYMDSKMIFKFEPDVDMDTKVRLHIDVTVASPCKST